MTNRLQSRLAIALLFGGLFILAFLTATLVSGPIDFLYRSAAGLTTIRSVAQIAAIVAASVLFVAACAVAIPTAFQPTSRFRKVLYILPVYLLGFTLLVILSSFIGIGTTGALINWGMTQLTLSAVAIIAGASLSVIAVVIAAARAHLPERLLKTAMTLVAVSAVPGTIAAVGLVATVVIVSTTQPSFSFGGPGGPDGQQNRQNAPGAAGTQAAQGTAPALSNGPIILATQAANSDAPAGVGTPSAQGTASVGAAGQSGGPGGSGGQQGGPGGPDGGPGGGPGGSPTSFVSTFRLAGILAAVFAVIAVISTIGGLRALRKTPQTDVSVSLPRINYAGEARPVLLSVVAISVVGLAAAQIVPVNRENPPVQSTVQWDSPQTQQLWTRACADCHSNETKWPWYASFAPSSWLLAIHVKDARQQFNISDLSSIPAFRKSQLPDEAAMNIRNGSMPPADYLILHPAARLSDAEKQELIQGLQNTLSK